MHYIYIVIVNADVCLGLMCLTSTTKVLQKKNSVGFFMAKANQRLSTKSRLMPSPLYEDCAQCCIRLTQNLQWLPCRRRRSYAYPNGMEEPSNHFHGCVLFLLQGLEREKVKMQSWSPAWQSERDYNFRQFLELAMGVLFVILVWSALRRCRLSRVLCGVSLSPRSKLQ